MSVPAAPLRVDGRGRLASADGPRHIADMVEAVLFTAPGERINRPDFGCGLNQLVFSPVDVTAVGAAELQVRSGLQRWLGDVIEVIDVEVDLTGDALVVSVSYRILATGDFVAASFKVDAA